MRTLTRRCCQRSLTHPGRRLTASTRLGCVDGRRRLQIEAAPSSDTTSLVEKTSGLASNPDAVFEVAGNPYSLLSATLSPSQALHTRRGTLVGLSGDATSTVSTLRFLSPFRRALVGIPFLYQRLTSATPVTALIAPKSTCTSLAVLHLTGITDWKIAQRDALLAWTGSTLVLHPNIRDENPLSVSKWGSTSCTGRGLLALEGKGNIFSITLADENESYIAHPSNVLAYSLPSSTPAPAPPTPYRFKSSTLSLTVPAFSYNFSNIFPRSRFVTNMRNSDTYRTASTILQRIRTWSRRNIWGDRLFYRFTGPTTILIQSRATRLRDVLTERQVDEIADAPTGTVQKAITAQQAHETRVEGESEPKQGTIKPPKTSSPPPPPPKLNIATVQPGGQVRIARTTGFDALKS